MPLRLNLQCPSAFWLNVERHYSTVEGSTVVDSCSESFVSFSNRRPLSSLDFVVFNCFRRANVTLADFLPVHTGYETASDTKRLVKSDRMLEERKTMTTDAGRRPVGDNQNSLTVGNRSHSPVHTYNRDGAMRFDGNSGAEVNYEPNSFNGPTEVPDYRERPRTISGSVDRHDHRLDSDYYTQPGNLFRLMAPDARERLIGNIVASMKSVPRPIQELQVQHFYKADPDYGSGVARGLGLNWNESSYADSKLAAANK
jgi:Catalase-related immune-responsive/Catalase